MKVLLLTTDAYGGHGGIALYNRDIIHALTEMDEVDEIAVMPRNMPLPPETIPAKVTFHAEVVGSKLKYIAASIKELRAGYDLVICGHINLLPLAALLNLLIRAPLVLMVYGIDVWAPAGRLSNHFLSKVDAIWSISAITRDRMNAWAQLNQNKYTLLPNAIHLERYGVAARKEAFVERYNLHGNKVIMTLARLPGADRYKGIDEVLEVMPDLLASEPALKYMVVGDGEDRARLEKKAASLGIADKVIFTGRVNESDKADIIRLADAFVMPGRGEGFGFVFLEALACGVPVVGSKVDGSREALREGSLGELVDPTDPASIKAGILAALKKPQGIPEGLRYFAWPGFTARLAEAVRSMSKRRHGRNTELHENSGH